MPVALDTNYLVAWLQPKSLTVPNDPSTDLPITKFEARIDYMIQSLTNSGTKIIIPTPVLAEFLEGAGNAGPAMLAMMSQNKSIRIAEFGKRAAIETAALASKRRLSGRRLESGPRQKTKVDTQILAIALVERAECLYTNDQGLRNLCREVDLTTIDYYELPLPDDDTPPLLRLAREED